MVDLGLGAGEQGGRVIYPGSFAELLEDPQSPTARYMPDETIPIPVEPAKHPQPLAIRVVGAREHNLRGIDIEIPLNTLTCITAAIKRHHDRLNGAGAGDRRHPPNRYRLGGERSPSHLRVSTHSSTTSCGQRGSPPGSRIGAAGNTRSSSILYTVDRETPS